MVEMTALLSYLGTLIAALGLFVASWHINRVTQQRDTARIERDQVATRYAETLAKLTVLERHYSVSHGLTIVWHAVDLSDLDREQLTVDDILKGKQQ